MTRSYRYHLYFSSSLVFHSSNRTGLLEQMPVLQHIQPSDLLYGCHLVPLGMVIQHDRKASLPTSTAAHNQQAHRASSRPTAPEANDQQVLPWLRRHTLPQQYECAHWRTASYISTVAERAFCMHHVATLSEPGASTLSCSQRLYRVLTARPLRLSPRDSARAPPV